MIERGFLPQYKFGEADLITTIGPDGLVVNTAKYLEGQPILPINPDPVNNGRLPWDTSELIFTVREPFPSKVTGTQLTFGVIDKLHPLTITSHMADNGVIFSDGIEADYVSFNLGATATIGVANRKANILGSKNHPISEKDNEHLK